MLVHLAWHVPLFALLKNVLQQAMLKANVNVLTTWLSIPCLPLPVP